MPKENYDVSNRIRHVPIKVESRESSRRDCTSRNRQYLCSDGTQLQGPGHDTFIHQVVNQNLDGSIPSERITSNDTSSVDIKYKPRPPPRQTSPQHRTSNIVHTNTPEYATMTATDDQIEERKSRSCLREKNKESRSREKFNSAKQHPSNSDKLVNSPEPIPLPPPQTQAFKRPNHEPAEANHSPTIECNSLGQQEQIEKSPMKVNVEKTSNTPAEAIKLIKKDISSLLEAIVNFDGISNKSKDYRYLDEMLTRCVLNLDDVDCGGSLELRHQRKTAIISVDQATNILQRKLSINVDVHNLNLRILDLQ